MNRPVQPELLGDALLAPSPEHTTVPPSRSYPEVVPTAKPRIEPPRWGVDDPDVIIREQPATAVFENVYGAIVIRHQAAWDEESDPYVWIQPPAIIAALQRYLPR
jgi:hypothetical protein